MIENYSRIRQIKMMRLIQDIEYDLEKHFNKIMVSSSTNLNLRKKEIEDIVLKKTGCNPDVTIEYDKDSYSFIIRIEQEHIGLRVSIVKNDYGF